MKTTMWSLVLLFLASTAIAVPSFKTVIIPKAKANHAVPPPCHRHNETGRLTCERPSGNVTRLPPLKGEPRVFQFVGFEEFHVHAKKVILGDTASDIQQGIAMAKDIIDTIGPILDAVDLIPGVGEITAMLQSGCDLIGLITQGIGQSGDTDEIAKLRQALLEQFSKISQQLSTISQEIKSISDELDADFAEQDFHNDIETPVNDLMALQQTYFDSPTDHSLDSLRTECANHDPITIFNRIRDIVTVDFYVKSLAPSKYAVDTLNELTGHIFRQINNVIFLSGVCLKVAQPEAVDIDYTEATNWATTVLDVAWNARNDFGVSTDNISFHLSLSAMGIR